MFKPILRIIIEISSFFLIGIFLFTALTNLMRERRYDGDSLVGFYSEDNIDAVFVGGSATFVYWQPLLAYETYGFTSYDYATNSLQYDGTKYYIKECLKQVRPKVFVVELRQFTSNEITNVYETALRNGTDSMDWYSLNRFSYIFSYLKQRIDSDQIDKPALFFDLIKYHTNTNHFASVDSWKYIDNRINNDTKGFHYVDKYDCLEEPVQEYNTELGEVADTCINEISEIIDLCNEESIDVIFVASPYNVGRDAMGKLNALEAYVTDRGYICINTNKFYADMGIDFSTDFYNDGHVNCLGAYKYTQYLGKIIADTYNLPDHRDDNYYSKWNELSEIYKKEQKEHEEKQQQLRQDYLDSLDKEFLISKENDILKWSNYLKEPRYTYIVTFNNADKLTEGISRILFNSSTDYFQYGTGVYSLGKIIKRDNSGKIGIGNNESVPYEINAEGVLSVIINDHEYIKYQNDSVNVVIVDTVLGRVVDSVMLVENNNTVSIVR